MFRRILSVLPRVVYDVLRPARTVALWAAGPVDRLASMLDGAPGRPPLWLRRHTGPTAAYERAAGEFSAMLALLGAATPDARVLDIGCGTGVMGREFERMLGDRGLYVGFDVHAPAVAWARRRFATDERFRFVIADIATPYSSADAPPATEYRFPVDADWGTLLIAKSVFTHLLEPETEHYLREIARTLALDGSAVITAFLLEDDRQPDWAEPMFHFPHGNGAVRWEIAAKPTAAVAYERKHFEAIVSAAGLRVEQRIRGYWTGCRIAPSGQDVLVLRRV